VEGDQKRAAAAERNAEEAGGIFYYPFNVLKGLGQA
jgi:hypothetical protein